MFLNRPAKKGRVSLRGAVQISDSSFFVCSDENGNTFLKSGTELSLNKSVVSNMLKLNPAIKNILNKYKIKPSVDTKIFKELSGGHMNTTCHIAEGIYSILSENMRSQIQKNSIKEASMLHDFGKILIPSKILNKPAKLNSKEREIMNIHSTLGYEMLKTQKINPETLDLIKYHHQNLARTGYPDLEEGKNLSDIAVQIISIADKYSALREARVYRHKLNRLEALLVLYSEVREGKIHPEIFKALMKYAEINDFND